MSITFHWTIPTPGGICVSIPAWARPGAVARMTRLLLRFSPARCPILPGRCARLMTTVCYLPGTAFRDFPLTICRQGSGMGQIMPTNLPQCCYARIPDRLTRFVFIPLPCHPCLTLQSGQSRTDELIQTCAGAARSASKSLYIEEFITCPSKTECSVATRREYVNEVLAAIQAHNVPLASVWVYGRKMIHDPNSLSFDDDTASILQMIGDFNRKWSR